MIAAAIALFVMTTGAAAAGILLHGKSADVALYVSLACLMVLFCALRPIGADQDSIAYYFYYNLDTYSLSLVVEPSFIVIAKISDMLSKSNGIHVIFFIYALIGVSIKFFAIRKMTSLYWLSVIVYCSNYLLLHEFTQIRAGVASGIILLAIYFAHQRKPIEFIACIACASIFHYSALVVTPMYLFSNREIKRIDLMLLHLAIPAGVILSYLKINFVYIIPIELVKAKTEIYIQAESLRDIKLNPFNAVYMVKYVLLYVLLFFWRKLMDLSSFFSIMIKFYAISLFAYLALSFNSAFAIRISELFGIVEIILIPILCYLTRNMFLAFFGVFAYSAATLALALFETRLIQEV